MEFFLPPGASLQPWNFLFVFFSFVLFAVLFRLFLVSTVGRILVVFSDMPEFFLP